MDDRLAINVAKTELRDGFNAGNVERVLAVFQSGFTDWSDGLTSKYGSEARDVLGQKLTDLFSKYHVKLTPIVIHIEVLDGVSYDWGWHEFILTPKKGGEPIRKRERYFEIWRRDAESNYKISFFISNQDVAEVVNGVQTQWFRSERTETQP